jgi:hypothetical protein
MLASHRHALALELGPSPLAFSQEPGTDLPGEGAFEGAGVFFG